MTALGSSFADLWRLICASGVIAKALHPYILRCDIVDFHPLTNSQGVFQSWPWRGVKLSK